MTIIFWETQKQSVTPIELATGQTIFCSSKHIEGAQEAFSSGFISSAGGKFFMEFLMTGNKTVKSLRESDATLASNIKMVSL